MSTTHLESSSDSSFYDEGEYYGNSTFDDEDEESTTNDDKDAVLSDLMVKELQVQVLQTKTTNSPSRSNSGIHMKRQMMTTGEIAELLLKVRLEGEDDLALGSESVPNSVDVDKNCDRDPASFSVISSKPSENVDMDDRTNKTNHPQIVLDNILKQNGYKSDKIPFEKIPDDFFLRMTNDNTKAYTKDTLKAVRMKDVYKLEQYLSEGKNLQCCNKFGESILSMACREGSTNVVDFLLNRANTSIRICDDYGKTPLHNACWTSEPNFDLIVLLLRQSADLCIVCDKRGHTPLDYVRIDQHENWNSFLLENKDLIQPTVLGERLP